MIARKVREGIIDKKNPSIYVGISVNILICYLYDSSWHCKVLWAGQIVNIFISKLHRKLATIGLIYWDVIHFGGFL